LISERVAEVILAAQKKFNFSHIIAGASANSRGVLPRVAAKLDVSPISGWNSLRSLIRYVKYSEVTEIHGEDTFSRPTYAGNAIAKVKSKAPIKVFTVRATAFEPAQPTGGNASVHAGKD